MNIPPLAPETLFDDDGRPRFGHYRGFAPTTDLGSTSKQLRSTAGRWLREKQWQWFTVADQRIACGGTLLDVGYATSVFLWVYDRRTGRMLADVSDILPPFALDIDVDPQARTIGSFRGLSRTLTTGRTEEGLKITADFGQTTFDLLLGDGPFEPLTAICPVTEDDEDEASAVNVTQKQVYLPTEGRITTEGRSFRFDPQQARGLHDFSHGLLARDTSWKWAIAGGQLDDGTPVGFNFTSGFNKGYENAVWLGDTLQTVGPVTFERNPDNPSDPWHVRSADGGIDLTLLVETMREHRNNYRIVSSEYIQPIGSWQGRVIDREVHDLFGIAEHHVAHW